MDRKKLTIPQMVKAGVPEEDAKAAWELVYTPERLAADAKRRGALQELREHGPSPEDILRMASVRIAGRSVPPKSDK
jgi:hypothetical protein